MRRILYFGNLEGTCTHAGLQEFAGDQQTCQGDRTEQVSVQVTLTENF